MKRGTILTILLASALAFAQKKAQRFEVSDLSASDSPVSFTGATMVLKTGTACVVTAHNSSGKSLLAMVATADVATRYEWDQPVTFQYDGFSKETLIGPGLDFEVVDEGMYRPSKSHTSIVFWLSHHPRILSATLRPRSCSFSLRMDQPGVTTRLGRM